MDSKLIILAIWVVADLSKANAVALAAGLLLILQLLKADASIFRFIEQNGMFWGLVLLTAALLIPIIQGRVSVGDLGHVFSSWVGIFALGLSLLTTYLSGLGLHYLSGGHAEILPALILGAAIAAAFLGGVPVGPLITSGLLAVALKCFPKLK
ncbi:MAG TPA: DUF441 family protein [Bacillota bacterium]|nr:DUF441 family protein [Bacillota bacterium]